MSFGLSQTFSGDTYSGAHRLTVFPAQGKTSFSPLAIHRSYAHNGMAKTTAHDLCPTYGFAGENPSTNSCVLDEEQCLLVAARAGCQQDLGNCCGSRRENESPHKSYPNPIFACRISKIHSTSGTIDSSTFIEPLRSTAACERVKNCATS